MTMPFVVRVPLALAFVLATLPACSGDDGGAEEASESESESEESSGSTESGSTESSSTESSSTESESSSETGTGETSGDVCEVASWDAGPEAEQCAVFVTCEVELDHQVNCSADGCICLENGADVGSCDDAASVCASPDDTALLAACCGWPF